MAEIRIEAKPLNPPLDAFGHIYLVFVDDTGAEFVVRSGPSGSGIGGQIVVQVGVPMAQSFDSRPISAREERGSAVLDLEGRDANDVWNLMLQQAQNIHDEQLGYNALSQNSNSTIASVLHVIGIDLNDVAPDIPNHGDIYPGEGSILDSFGFELAGTSAHDLIVGGGSSDTFTGGMGNDVFVIQNTTDSVGENFGEGDDLIMTSVDFDMPENVERLTMTGSDDIGTNGNDLANHINGNTGDNYINGGVGTDLMNGGAGNDTYTIDNLNDVVVELAGGGDDVIYASISAALSGNVETLILTTNAGQNAQAFGDDTNNQIFGNEFDNVIFGRGGTDYMEGLGGNDIFVITPENGLLDVIGDFIDGQDRLGFSGFGTFDEGARVFQVSATSYRVDSADGNISQVFVLQNYTGTALDHVEDYYFV